MSAEPSDDPTADHSRFERARIIGARALQISMGAPVLVEVPPKTMNAMDIAIIEYDEGLLPMTTEFAE